MSSSQFDPVLVDVFGRIPLEELRKVRLECPDESPDQLAPET